MPSADPYTNGSIHGLQRAPPESHGRIAFATSHRPTCSCEVSSDCEGLYRPASSTSAIGVLIGGEQGQKYLARPG